MTADARLRTALWLPPAAWFLALVGTYALVPWACTNAVGRAGLHLVSLGTLTLVGAGLLAAWKSRHAAGGGRPDQEESAAEPGRFLPTLALLVGVLFAAIIVVQWIAILLLDPCVPGLPMRFSPRL